ncbi:Tryptophan 5-hydroxylase 2 [Nymphon striatum]|nr:Tryptophan 5-hydroxylase 2 [Nymphon striatum]
MVEASIDSSDEDIFQNYAGKNGIKPYRFEPKRRRLNADQHGNMATEADFAVIVSIEDKNSKYLPEVRQVFKMMKFGFPTKIEELDTFAHSIIPIDMPDDHPGKTDEKYKQRRQACADIAFNYKHGDPIPRIEYTEEEVRTWGILFSALRKLHGTHACKEINNVFPDLIKHCGYREDNVPQLVDVSKFLKSRTGFTLRPVAGFLSSRDFLAGLAFKVFHCTQYMRHPSDPHYSFEPDVCHELMGHVAMFCDPPFAEFSQQIGLASLGASDDDIRKLATCYLFTVEFGLCKENGNFKAYGAGLLSSSGELQHAISSKAIRKEFIPKITAEESYMITDFQNFYFFSQSIDEAKEKMKTGDLSLEEVMRYELSPYPPSLFEDKNILQKADKPQLAQAIIAHCNKTPSCKAISDTIPQTEMYMLDGGALLHKHKWTRGDTYGKIAKTYADFTSKQYGSATVVFDGYLAGPSIKDNTHQRRGQATIHPIVNFTGETEFEGKKEEFLSRGSNKQHLISLISDELERVGCTVIQAEGDADVDIAKTAVNIANVHSTTLIGEDTDLLVLLLHYCEMDGKPLYFRSDKQSRGVPKVYNISWIKRLLGSEMCPQIVFLHAFTGCDSTSRVYGVGKKPAFEKLVKGDQVLQSSANAFTLRGRNHTDVENLGIQAMSVTFGGESTCSLATLHYRIFTKKIAAAKSFITPERLPPTESATKFHCLRVYYQTMTWMGMESGIDPLDWGWKLEDNQLVPIMPDMNAAPDALLKMVHCNCTTGCSGPRCSCRKHGLPCTSACGSCQLTHCDNQLIQVADELEDSDDD